MKKDLWAKGGFSAVLRTFIFGPVALIFWQIVWSYWYDDPQFMISFLIIALISSISLVINWVWALFGGPLRGIRKFYNQSHDPEAMMKRIEKVWDEGFITASCRADEEYFVWARGMRGMVIPMREIAGLSYGGGVLWYPGYLVIRLKNGKTKRFNSYPKNGEKIVEHIMAIRMTL